MPTRLDNSSQAAQSLSPSPSPSSPSPSSPSPSSPSPSSPSPSSPSPSSTSPSPSPSQIPLRASRDLAVRQRNDGRTASGSKRKRNNTIASEPPRSRRMTQGPDGDDFPTNYDPDQPPDERRQVQRDLRDLLKNVNENAEALLQRDSRALLETIDKANELSKGVQQTTAAAIDSRLLVTTTDLSYRKTLRLSRDDLSQGVDIDELVSKSITYMRNGGGISDDDAPELSTTQRQRRTVSRHRGNEDDDDEDEDEIGDEGDMMNWQHLGRFACSRNNRRPAVPGFLLGPLSVEKKARKASKRSAPFRPQNLTETRPEVLNVEDLARKENDLTATCTRILQRLCDIQTEIQGFVHDQMDDAMDEDEGIRIMHQSGLRSTGGIDLMHFVVNPHSFGQTVENMFYVSFLIRDGRVTLELDEFDIPSIAPIEQEPIEDGTQRRGASKHQAILSMDEKTWREIIDVFNIERPMIPHRKEAVQNGPGARGWYN